MLNKLKFNNLVISNKKSIQQSRIQTINKLVHKIRKLKTLSEKYPENIKFKERIRKSTETMEILKKLKRVDIMKKVLLLDKPAASVITNGIAIPEEIAVALLSMNKAMQGLIKRFKTELKIVVTEGDDWKEVLMESSKRERKMKRTEEKRRKRLEVKQQKAIGRKRQEWLEEHHSKIGVEYLSTEDDRNISSIGDWQVQELSNNSVEGEKEPMNNMIKIKKTSVTKETVTSNKKLQIIKAYQNSAENNAIEDTDIKPLNTGINANAKKLNTYKNEDEDKNSLVVDPFFITDTGENYMSTAVIEKECISEPENNEKRHLHMIKLKSFGKKHSEFKESRNQKRQIRNKWKSQDMQDKKNITKHNKNNKPFQKQFNDKNNVQTRNQNSYTKNLTNTHRENILHPSWAAKQKLIPIITQFKGRKITFDDNLDKTNYFPENDTKSNNSTVMKSNDSKKDSIHPSWAAKQKLKPSIKAFQGKKITFENDE